VRPGSSGHARTPGADFIKQFWPHFTGKLVSNIRMKGMLPFYF
jgi:hypothetical protein